MDAKPKREQSFFSPAKNENHVPEKMGKNLTAPPVHKFLRFMIDRSCGV
jgi:hypothetical protein